MSDIAIQIDGLGKRYKIGLREKAGDTLRETMMHSLTAPFRRFRHLREKHHSEEEVFWALRDVSLDVHPGEVVGVIGRNGAGKSTLLKILSRITEPTEGRAVIHGRVGSLLEVGTGFHPDLTGRENIFLNGAILGMKRSEIVGKFDEIVSFAEIDKFLDTPVKRYSSGMRVRLGFAVAAHLNPEILIVDEILAVGDFAFQKKCLGKMEAVASGGRTVLFVSHNMGVVQELCTRAVLLHHGKVVTDGYPSTVISEYLQLGGVQQHAYSVERDDNKLFQILEISVVNKANQSAHTFDLAEPVIIRIKYIMTVALEGSVLTCLLNRQGVTLAQTYDTDQLPDYLERRSAGVHTCTVTVPAWFLKPGAYAISAGLGIARQRQLDYAENAAHFDVVSHSVSDTYKAYAAERSGLVVFPGEWKVLE